MKTPISLLVDDPCPIIHVFRDHWVDVHHKPPATADGRPLTETIPNSFLDRFCDVMEGRGIKGKFSIVPAPSGKGDIVRGIEGYDPQETFEWRATAKKRLGPLCDFCPEMITHNLALDLDTGRFYEVGESEWSQTQDRSRLLPYIEHGLRLLKEAGFDCTGVTSPWVFGQQVLAEYEWSIREAQRRVYGREFSWYFLHMLFDRPEMRPWVAKGTVPDSSPPAPSPLSQSEKGEGVLVAIPATVRDYWWATIDSARTDEAFISEVADRMLTKDGLGGDVPRILEAGGWPVLLTHWQSLWSNGLESGLRVLDVLAERIERNLGGQVEWVKCSEMAERTVTATSP